MTREMTSGGAADWHVVMREALNEGAETLTPGEVVAMRRTVIAAARHTVPGTTWRRPLAIAATLLLMIGVGAAAGRRFEARRAAVASPVEQIPPAAGEQLQLQFATPGGTRIIWVFNSDLDLKAMVQ